jgi:hypothetical protein
VPTSEVPLVVAIVFRVSLIITVAFKVLPVEVIVTGVSIVIIISWVTVIMAGVSIVVIIAGVSVVIVVVVIRVSIIIVMFEVLVVIITGIMGPIVFYISSILVYAVAIQGFILSVAGMLHAIFSISFFYLWRW